MGQKTKKIASLDDADKRILRILQQDNQKTLEQISAIAALSPSAVRRRIGRMRSQGIIEADVSILALTDLGVEVVVHVMMQQESSASYSSFRRRVLAADEVTQCYSVTGEIDFILHVRMPDLTAFDDWIADFILDDPNVRRCDSHVVYSRVKYTTAIPLE